MLEIISGNIIYFNVFIYINGSSMNYVKKHNNNYARWYSLKEDHQRLYRQRVQSIKSRTVNKIK